MDLPSTHFAKSGDVHIAYQVFGSGRIDLVFVPGWISHLDHWWDSPVTTGWLERFGRFARVIMFDKRGTGLSDRDFGLPTMEQRIDDIRAVMDATKSRQAAILGISEGGTLAALFAASHPERCQALILHGAFARFTSLLPTEDDLEAFFDYVSTQWGTGANVAKYSASRKDDRAYRIWWARRERAAASPSTAMALMKMNSEIDISGILPTIQVPTLVIHRSNDTAVDVDGGRLLAHLIPNAQFLETPGQDHTPWTGDDVDDLAERIEEFLTGAKPIASIDRVLSTVLFTDIVASTEKAQSLGDHRWKAILSAHDDLVRQALSRFRGQEVKSLGDGFLATFDGPGRAVHCALEAIDAARSLGLELRAGVHTGEIELREGDVQGLSVHIAARIAQRAGAGECLVSRTIKDLVAGSELIFESRGAQALKGLAESIELYAASR